MPEGTSTPVASGASVPPVVPASPSKEPPPIALQGLPAELQILTAEHSSLLTARSLVYNEAFTRASMFLDLLGMSFVGLALLATATGFDRDFLIVAVIVIGFDFLVGTLTYVRVMKANAEDFRAMHAMNRIRHGYVLIAPSVRPFFVASTHDDADGVMESYGYTSSDGGRDLIYGLSTSGGMVGLVLSLVGGLFAAVIALLVGASTLLVLLVGAAGAGAVFAVGAWWALAEVGVSQAAIDVKFPTPPDGSAPGS